jgi:hypothetical protein
LENFVKITGPYPTPRYINARSCQDNTHTTHFDSAEYYLGILGGIATHFRQAGEPDAGHRLIFSVMEISALFGPAGTLLRERVTLVNGEEVW